MVFYLLAPVISLFLRIFCTVLKLPLEILGMIALVVLQIIIVTIVNIFVDELNLYSKPTVEPALLGRALLSIFKSYTVVPLF